MLFKYIKMDAKVQGLFNKRYWENEIYRNIKQNLYLTIYRQSALSG